MIKPLKKIKSQTDRHGIHEKAKQSDIEAENREAEHEEEREKAHEGEETEREEAEDKEDEESDKEENPDNYRN
jgi:hypothetical protein